MRDAPEVSPFEARKNLMVIAIMLYSLKETCAQLRIIAKDVFSKQLEPLLKLGEVTVTVAWDMLPPSVRNNPNFPKVESVEVTCPLHFALAADMQAMNAFFMGTQPAGAKHTIYELTLQDITSTLRARPSQPWLVVRA